MMPDTILGSPQTFGGITEPVDQLSFGAGLFESPQRTCEQCSAEIPASRHRFAPKQIKHFFCSRKCQIKFHNKTVTLRQREQIERNNVFYKADPITSNLSETHKQIVADYQRGIGLKTLERIYGVARSTMRPMLIRAGVYAPDPKHNGFAKKGLTKRVREQAKQQADWRRQQRLILLRKEAAACLRYMYRQKCRLETACRTLGLSYGRTYGTLKTRRSYQRLTIKTGFWSAEYRRLNQRSKIFQTEKDIQTHVETLLKEAGIPYHTEYDVEGSRADFRIGDYIVEAKIQTNCKAAYALAGQLLHAQVCHPHLKRIALLPSDCSLKQSLTKMIQSLACICTEKDIIPFIKDQSAIPAYRQYLPID